jgi:hypothetical protein
MEVKKISLDTGKRGKKRKRKSFQDSRDSSG